MAVLYRIQYIINTIVNWLYKPFARLIPKETFKYAFCGGANTTLDIFLYFITYNFILHKKMLNLKFIAISPHIASFLACFFQLLSQQASCFQNISPLQHQHYEARHNYCVMDLQCWSAFS